MANSKLTRTPSSTGNRQIHTISAWVKRSKLNYDYAYILTAGTYNSTQMVQLKWDSDDHLIYSGYNSGGGQEFRLESTAAYRDTSGWYHVVVACDSTQGTASNRVKIYVNGEQVTAFDEASYPSSSYDSALNSQIIHTIGLRDGTSSYFDGYMSHVAVVDGPALTPATKLDVPDVVDARPVDVKVPFNVRPVSAACVSVMSVSAPNPRTALSDLSVTSSVKFTSSVPVGICMTDVSASFFMVISFVVP